MPQQQFAIMDLTIGFMIAITDLVAAAPAAAPNINEQLVYAHWSIQLPPQLDRLCFTDL